MQVVIVEPGALRTEMAGRGGVTLERISSDMTPEQERRYGGLMQAILTQSEGFLKNGVDASSAAKAIATAATVRRPKARYTIGRDAAILIRLARILPDRMLERLPASALRGLLPETN